MDKDNEIFETEIEEKESIEGEVVDQEIVGEDENFGFDPNVILNTIMQSQDMGLRNVLSKLSISNAVTKATVVCLLIGFIIANFFNYIGVITLIYGLYCSIYVLVNYKVVKEHENSIKDLFSKDGTPVDLKKTIWKNLIILLLCIPLAIVSIWYWTVYAVS